ncbi:hypothetical protein [Exiguobacterium aurantiacum]|uniref:Uncharacterized protein n=1 Tax=Exiguobacterium aurantiacum TaxID=33987 RepID=A0ABY5FQD5_9BACL|nr:hypothetical protein [Exiguobacterium aurantiacum]UTT43820.1 hypothetical protein NMQ00_04770 [Exiguobacterium aurantiacum]
MRRFVSAYGWMMVAALLLGGCDEEQRVVNNEPDDDEAITIAWAYVTARNWQEPAIDAGATAEVQRVTVDDDYELLDDAYAGTEALAVSFEVDPNSSVGVPTILIAPETNTVVGYLPAE